MDAVKIYFILFVYLMHPLMLRDGWEIHCFHIETMIVNLKLELAAI